MITRFNQDAFRTLTYSIDYDQIAVKYSKFDSLEPGNHTLQTVADCFCSYGKHRGHARLAEQATQHS